MTDTGKPDIADDLCYRYEKACAVVDTSQDVDLEGASIASAVVGMAVATKELIERIAKAEAEIRKGFDAIFYAVPQAEEGGKDLTLAAKIQILTAALRACEEERDFFASQVNVNRDGVNVVSAILAERDALQKQVERLSAPVSDEEWNAANYQQAVSTGVGKSDGGGTVMLRSQSTTRQKIDALIQSRAAHGGEKP